MSSGGVCRATSFSSMGRPPNRRKSCLLCFPVLLDFLVVRNDVIDQSIVLRLFGRHEAIAVHILLDRLDGLSGVLGVKPVQLPAREQDLLRLERDIGGGALLASGGLVHHYPRVWQCGTLPFAAGREEE